MVYQVVNDIHRCCCNNDEIREDIHLYFLLMIADLPLCVYSVLLLPPCCCCAVMPCYTTWCCCYATYLVATKKRRVLLLSLLCIISHRLYSPPLIAGVVRCVNTPRAVFCTYDTPPKNAKKHQTMICFVHNNMIPVVVSSSYACRHGSKPNDDRKSVPF